MRKRKVYLDERQQIELGKAFRNAFLTMAVALLICCTMNGVFDERIFDDGAILTIPLWISLAAFYTTIIVRDALYINNKDNYAGLWLALAICWLIFGVAELWLFVKGLQYSDRDGFLGTLIKEAIQGICMLEAGMVYFVKRIKDIRKSKAAEKLDQTH